MIGRWFRKIITPNKNVDFPKNTEEKKIIELIDFLWKEIDIPSNAINLKTKISYFKELSFTHKIDSLTEIYLLLEEHLIEKNIIQRYSKQQLRTKVLDSYGELRKYTNFKLIFQPLKEQELTICKIFLSEVLKKASELIGSFNDSEILQIKQYLTTQHDGLVTNLVSERKKLLNYSLLIFSKIKDSLGENVIANIYLLIYQKHFQSYHLLDSFTATLNVIPEEILSKDLINFPSKQQMLKMLKKQLHNLQDINDQLSKEIIERKKIEEELKHSEHLKANILETAMDGIILVNSQGIVLNWNKQAETILEVKRKETIGRSIYSLVPYKLRQELKSSIYNYIHTGDDLLINRRVETSVQRKDKTTVHIELTIIAIKIKNDYLFNAFFRDITNKKTIDNEIREAKVSAEKSAKAKSVFLSNMSHEIRTPLNVILGLTSIIKKGQFEDPESDKKNLEGIQFSAENLLVLINDILDFSKIEAGKLTLHKTDFNIHELITNLSRGFSIKAEEKGLTYTTNIDSKLPKFIIGDQFRLNQILTNLLGNAIKFTHKGEVSINVYTKEEEKDTCTINFAVEDTGVGIPEDKLKNIFRSFYQVHKPGKNKIEGTGLGLSISKQLIELQNGYLNVKSEPGKGSVFEFSITYKKSKLSTYIKNQKSKNQKISNFSHLSGLNVLVVEDNKMNQFFIKQLFSNWNIAADIADHGKIALKKLENNTYDLILMDMHMPVMDGPETTINIRKSSNPKINQIPIIACSADVFPESKKAAIESGMNFYLTKPISEKALEEIIISLQSPSPLLQKKALSPNTTISTISTRTFCDFSSLEQTFDNDPDIIKSILNIFLEESTKDYKTLQKAIKDKDLLTSQSMAHKLKSSFKTLGLNREAEILKEIEHSSENITSQDKNSLLIKKLDSDFPLIIQEIKTLLTERNS